MKELIKKCKDFERTAQKEVVALLSPMLFSICRRYSFNDKHASNDLVQEALIKIFNNIDKCHAKDELTFRAWCKRIAINNALAKKRKNSIYVEEITHDYSKNYEFPEVLASLNVDDILKLLEQIPEHHRLVFNLSIIDGYNHKEIASILKIKEASSRTFLTRARQTMQKLIKQEWGLLNIAK